MFCLEGHFSVENLNVIEVINFLIGLDLRQCYSDLGGGIHKICIFFFSWITNRSESASRSIPLPSVQCTFRYLQHYEIETIFILWIWNKKLFCALPWKPSKNNTWQLRHLILKSHMTMKTTTPTLHKDTAEYCVSLTAAFGVVQNMN